MNWLSKMQWWRDRDAWPFPGDKGKELWAALPAWARQPLRGLPADAVPDSAAYEAAQAALQDRLRRTGADALPGDVWLMLFRQLFALGCFHSAVICRGKGRELALRHADKPDAGRDQIDLGFRAALDQGEPARAASLLERLRACKGFGRLTAERYQSFLALHQGDLEGFRAVHGEVDSSVEQRFRDEVAGSGVAIVGPAPTEAAHGGEIDGMDWVVRANYYGHDRCHIAESCGSRTDISCYAFGIMSRIERENRGHEFIEWLSVLRWAVLKNIDFPYQEEASRQTGKVILRKWNPLLFHGDPNLTPSNIYTFLAHGARRVKIFNSNFYFSKNRRFYIDHYERGKPSKERMLRSFAGHDLITQLNFMRSLYKAGVIELDDEAAEVAGLSEEDYAEGLESLYILT